MPTSTPTTASQQALQRSLQTRLSETVKEGKLAETCLPLCPSVKLFLLSEDYPRGRLDHDDMLAIMNDPAYWAFCWASGQVLAAYIVANPSLVRNRRVLDFGTGSGVVAIAAKLAGAAEVIACDIDPTALLATEANATLNGVSLDLLDDVGALDREIDLIIAADVLYDRDNFPWIKALPGVAPEVLIADSRVKTDRLVGYEIINRVTATTIPDLDELKEFNDVRIYLSQPRL